MRTSEGQRKLDVLEVKPEVVRTCQEDGQLIRWSKEAEVGTADRRSRGRPRGD